MHTRSIGSYQEKLSINIYTVLNGATMQYFRITQQILGNVHREYQQMLLNFVQN